MNRPVLLTHLKKVTLSNTYLVKTQTNQTFSHMRHLATDMPTNGTGTDDNGVSAAAILAGNSNKVARRIVELNEDDIAGIFFFYS